MQENFAGFWRGTLSFLNITFWIASVVVWVSLVARSGILTGGVPDAIFWPNFFIFLAAGVGVLATTHFLAAMLPVSVGLMTLIGTAADPKGNWLLINVYVVLAIVIGFVAAIAKLNRFVSRETEPPAP